jgi:hypothetical protein
MVDLIERKSLKLLAQAGQTLNQILGEDQVTRKSPAR